VEKISTSKECQNHKLLFINIFIKSEIALTWETACVNVLLMTGMIQRISGRRENSPQ
jgi:hypothetical protein